MKSRRHSAPLPPPEKREFLDALAAMLADAVLREQCININLKNTVHKNEKQAATR